MIGVSIRFPTRREHQLRTRSFQTFERQVALDSYALLYHCYERELLEED